MIDERNAASQPRRSHAGLEIIGATVLAALVRSLVRPIVGSSQAIAIGAGVLAVGMVFALVRQRRSIAFTAAVAVGAGVLVWGAVVLSGVDF
jgi:hypothetical protein